MANDVRRVRRKRRVRAPYGGPRRISKAAVAVYVASVAAGFVLAFAFLSYAPRAYNSWRESRLVRRANELMQKDDLDGATRAAQQMLQISPDSVAAFHILADATEKQHKPE